MSSQENQGIPLHYAPDGVGYKLLEIPPELQALLESNEPPTLRIESSPAAALLKTADKTWSLRQKNTSNALIILRPSTASQASAEISQPGINAIATIHETIELVPESSDSAPVPAPKGKWHERFGRSR